MDLLIRNATLVNEGRSFNSDLLIRKDRIERIDPNIGVKGRIEEYNAENLHLLPGVIDDQVHFREPGLTHKATIETESRAAVAGGVTSFMEMPNTRPPVFTQELLEQKYEIASRTSLANYSFYMGVPNENNLDEVLRTNEKRRHVCGIKVFMGSSTGNLLVDNPLVLDRLFSQSELLIAAHCEDEQIIKDNMREAEASGRTLTAADHPLIRNEEACFTSSFRAIQFAKKYGARLHILHITTEKELQLFTNLVPLSEKRITAEVCVHHLHFTSDDYDRLGNLIKCNPAIKAPSNRDALWRGLLDDRLDVIATDHAPHTREEKNGGYLQAHAGLPLVQHPLLLMHYYVQQGKLTMEKMVEKMSHAVAACYQVADRGYLREGYYADLVVLDTRQPSIVSKKNIYYKCGWSPLDGFEFPASIRATLVNGNFAFRNDDYANPVFGASNDCPGARLRFNRS